MKTFVLTLVLTAALLSGCESDMPPEPNRENPIQRGIRGDGTVSPRDYSDDPFVRENSSRSY
jgi:hypothetical protein